MGEILLPSHNTNTDKPKEYTRREAIETMGIVGAGLASALVLSSCGEGKNIFGNPNFASDPSKDYYQLGLYDQYRKDSSIRKAEKGDWSECFYAKLPTKLDGKPIEINRAHDIATGIPELGNITIEILGGINDGSLESLIKYNSGDMNHPCDVVLNGEKITGYLLGPNNDRHNLEKYGDKIDGYQMYERNLEPRLAFEGPNGRGYVINIYSSTLSARTYFDNGWSEKLDSIAKLIAKDIYIEKHTY